jgi:hypothetical protein
MQTKASQTATGRVAAFFYGSFIRTEILAMGGFKPAEIVVARLRGFDIHISPHASVSRSDQHTVYGILVYPTHAELDRLYSVDWVGIFLPEAVIVETMDGKLQAALCYIPPSRRHEPADREYLEYIVAAARQYGFPAWYIRHLESQP